jgi:hypothetical protein
MNSAKRVRSHFSAFPKEVALRVDCGSGGLHCHQFLFMLQYHHKPDRLAQILLMPE